MEGRLQTRPYISTFGGGRDAADVALSTTFGRNTIKRFNVVTDEIAEDSIGVGVSERMVA